MSIVFVTSVFFDVQAACRAASGSLCLSERSNICVISCLFGEVDSRLIGNPHQDQNVFIHVLDCGGELGFASGNKTHAPDEELDIGLARLDPECVSLLKLCHSGPVEAGAPLSRRRQPQRSFDDGENCFELCHAALKIDKYFGYSANCQDPPSADEAANGWCADRQQQRLSGVINN